MRSYSKSVSPSSRCLDSLETLMEPVSRAMRRSSATPSSKAAPDGPANAANAPRDARAHPPPQAGLDPPQPVRARPQGPVAGLEALPELPDPRPLAPVPRRPLGLGLEVARDRVHGVLAQLIRRGAAPVRRNVRRARPAIGERIGTGGQVFAEAGLLDQPTFVDPLRNGIVVEDQAVVDLLEAPVLKGLAHRAPGLVSLQLPVVAGDLHAALVLLEGAKREVENADRERRRDHELQRVVLVVLGLGAEHRFAHQAAVGLAGPDLDRVRSAEADAIAGAVSGLRRAAKARLANRHPIGERTIARTGGELGSGGEHHPELIGDRLERLLQIPGRGPPELIGVVVDDPVRAHLAREAGDSLLAA